MGQCNSLDGIKCKRMDGNKEEWRDEQTDDYNRGSLSQARVMFMSVLPSQAGCAVLLFQCWFRFSGKPACTQLHKLSAPAERTEGKMMFHRESEQDF